MPPETTDGVTVADAVRRHTELTPVALPDQLVVELDLALPNQAELAATVPGTERVGPLTVRRSVDDPADLLKLVMAWYYLAAIPMGEIFALSARH